MTALPAASIGALTLQFGPPIACAVAVEDDRRWFERRIGRSHRLRKPIGDELAAFGPPPRPELVPMVAVRQLRPGYRIRAGLYATRALLNSEAVARQAYEIAATANRPRLGEFEWAWGAP